MGLFPLQVADQDLALNLLEFGIRLDNLPLPPVFLRLGKGAVVKGWVERAGRQQFIEGGWWKSQLSQQGAPITAERGHPVQSTAEQRPEEDTPGHFLLSALRRGTNRSARVGSSTTVPFLPARLTRASSSWRRTTSGFSDRILAVLARARAAATSWR